MTSSPPPPQPSWRKPFGILLVLVLIAVWAMIVVAQADHIATLAWPLQAIVYVFAGIIWIAPLKPLLRWMETGRWRVPPS